MSRRVPGYNKPRSANDVALLPAITMVEHTDVDQGQRGAQRLGQELVGPAGLGDTRRVVVRQDHCRSVQRQRRLTTSRGYTLVCVSVPRNISSGAMTRFCASRNSTMKTSWSRWASMIRK